MQGGAKAVRAPIADAMSSAVNPSWLSLASTLAPAAISSTAHASSPWELARISAVIPSISSWTGPYSAQLPAIRVPATPPGTLTASHAARRGGGRDRLRPSSSSGGIRRCRPSCAACARA